MRHSSFVLRHYPYFPPVTLDPRAPLSYSPPAMKSFFTSKRLQIFTVMLLVSAVHSSCCQAWSPASQPVEGVLVLRNGNLLRGKLQQQGDHYLVQLSNGELQVHEQQVEMVCQNIEEAYQRRRVARVGSTADSHVELARWCLRHDLFSHAEAEIQQAQAIDLNYPRLALLERQLKQSLQMELRKKQRRLAETDVAPEPTPLDPATLEKAPQWARALFVRQIQPLVVHACATGGCHQPGSVAESRLGSESKFHLNRLAIDGAGHPEATLRNLAATLQQIDWQSADQSNLLRRARQAHGSLDASIPLPPHKWRVLEGWVTQLAEAHRKETERKSLRLVAALPPKSGPQPTQPLVFSTQAMQQPPSEVRTATYEPKKVEPIDPFDPSGFNRRFATKATEPTAESTVPHVLVPSERALTPLPAAE